MKILLIGPEFLPLPNVAGGAVETLITQFLNFNEKNEKFDFVVYSPFHNKINDDITSKYKFSKFRYIKKSGLINFLLKSLFAVIYRIKKNDSVQSVYYYKVIKDLKQRNELDEYDMVILENGVRGAKVFRKNVSSKLILHLHNDYMNKNVANSKKTCEYFDEIWTVSNFVKKRIEEVTSNVKVKVLYNGIDLELFLNNKSNNSNSIFKKYNIEEEKKYILYSGRIMKEKGVLELIEAFNCFKSKEKNNYKLLVVGGFDGKNGKKYFDCLKSVASSDVIFLGKINYENIPLIYENIIYQVVPSIINEAFGMTIIEAMAKGVPVIATNSGGIPEIINSNNGILVDRKNIVENLAQAFKQMEDLINNDSNLTQACIETSKKYSNLEYCKTFEKYIFECASGECE